MDGLGHSQWSRRGSVCQRSQVCNCFDVEQEPDPNQFERSDASKWKVVSALGLHVKGRIRIKDPLHWSLRGFTNAAKNIFLPRIETLLNPWTMCRKFWLDLENLQLKFSPHSDGGAFCTTAGITSGRGTRSDRRRASFPYTVAIKKRVPVSCSDFCIVNTCSTGTVSAHPIAVLLCKFANVR
jgi:hypothetical protein